MHWHSHSNLLAHSALPKNWPEIAEAHSPPPPPPPLSHLLSVSESRHKAY